MARERVFLRCCGHHKLCAWALVAVGQPQSQCKYPGAPSPPHLQVIELLPRSSSIRIQHPAIGADAASPEPEVFHRENDHLRNEDVQTSAYASLRWAFPSPLGAPLSIAPSPSGAGRGDAPRGPQPLSLSWPRVGYPGWPGFL